MNASTTTGQTDDDLLAAFLDADDQDAFGEIVRRHGGLVAGVCRRILRHPADVDDAAQAVFLTLAQKANQVRGKRSLAGWLHHVARFIAMRALQSQQRRQHREGAAAPLALASADGDYPLKDGLRDILDNEVERLPTTCRVPFLLHHLEGRSQREVATMLGWSYGTVSGRLNRARSLLRTRLMRRGITATAVGAVFATTAHGATDHLIATSTAAGILIKAGHAASAVTIPQRISLLSGEAGRWLQLLKFKSIATLAGAIAAVALLIGGTALGIWAASSESEAVRPAGQATRPETSPAMVAAAGQPQPTSGSPKASATVPAAMDALSKEARKYAYGLGVHVDYAKAFALYSQSMANGSLYGERGVAWCFWTGHGVTKDLARTEHLLRDCAAKGHAQAMTDIGWLYVKGDGVTQDYVEARHWFDLAAALNDPSGQHAIAWMYYSGNGVSRDRAQCLAWVYKSAAQDYPKAQNLLGSLYSDGWAFPADVHKSFEWHLKAAEQGISLSRQEIGNMYADGRLGAPDLEKAVSYYRQAAEQGETHAMHQAGFILCWNLHRIDEGKRWFQVLAAQPGLQGIVGQVALGTVLLIADNDPKDNAQGIKLLQQTIDLGYPVGCQELAISHHMRRGGLSPDSAVVWPLLVRCGELCWQDHLTNGEWARWEGAALFMNDLGRYCSTGRADFYGAYPVKDSAKAALWWLRSAQFGDDLGQCNIANCYLNGIGIEQDAAQAAHWYDLSSKQGNDNAAVALGRLALDGNGMGKDVARGIALWISAAARNNSRAMLALAQLYDAGADVPHDPTAALKWYHLAAAAGEQAAKNYLAKHNQAPTAPAPAPAEEKHADF